MKGGNIVERLSQTLTIQQVSDRLGVTKHTLRFWEKELDGVIVPLRTEGGQRRYTSEHLFIIEEVKSLKNKGLSLLEIKKMLNNDHEPVPSPSNPQRVDLLADRIAEAVRSTVHSFFNSEKLQQ